MSINIEKLRRLNELVGLAFKRKHIIVLDPAQNKNSKDNIEEDIVYDKADWKMTDELNKYVKDLSNESNLSIEDKILSIYEKICKDYVYDDNLISYIQKIDDDVFDLPDWYGRDIDQEWENNREQHNRRICFELSRYLAKALSDLVKNNDDYDTCILWNKNLTHYFVGLTCENYSVALDLDDFFNIKDLTRLKTDLTAEASMPYQASLLDMHSCLHSHFSYSSTTKVMPATLPADFYTHIYGYSFYSLQLN